jgi:hypothetical protein
VSYSCNVHTSNFNYLFFASSKAETSSFLDEKLGQKSHEQQYGFYIGCIDCVWLLGGIGVGHRDQVVRDGN